MFWIARVLHRRNRLIVISCDPGGVGKANGDNVLRRSLTKKNRQRERSSRCFFHAKKMELRSQSPQPLAEIVSIAKSVCTTNVATSA